MFLRWAVILVAIILFNILDLGAADVAKVFKCPCRFSVARKVDQTHATHNEAFDVLVQNFAHPRSKFRKNGGGIIEKHSSRNVRVSDATHSDSLFSYFTKIDIRDSGLFRVRIRHHSTNAEVANPDYKLRLLESAKQVICPVVLAPDMPSERVASSSQFASPLNGTVRQHRIEGGLFAAPSLLPYLVSIAIPCSNGEPDCFVTCTGTLLSPKWVMTAAHCEIPEGSRVYISSSMKLTGFSVRVNRTIPHPMYDFASEARQNQFDIAVLELRRSVYRCCVPSPSFMPVSLDRALPRSGAFARAAGFGRVSEAPSAAMDPTDGALRSVDLPIVRHRVCRGQYVDATLDLISPRHQVCAGYFEDGGCDTCFGDSGGPLVQYDGNTPVLIGVTSFGLGCGDRTFPGVYTRPSGHKDWLISTGAVFREHRGTIDEVVVRCAPGEFLPYKPGRLSTCTRCRIGQFSIGGALRECQRCPQTLWRDPDDGAQCSCRARKGYGMVRGECVKCRPGFASPFGSNRCLKCRFGTFSNGFGRGACKRCPGAPPGSRRCAAA